MSRDQSESPSQPSTRLRGFVILGVSVLVFLTVIGAALLAQSRQDDKEITAGDSVGVSAAQAGCGPVEKSAATGGGDHRKEGTRLSFPDGPPASGPHWGNFLYGPQIRNFYTREDRPPVEQLVHSLEHGHTLVWYDETITPGTRAYSDLKAYAASLKPDDYLMMVPWNAADGAALPDGKHLALTHWTGPDAQRAVRQFCAAPSSEVLDSFRKEFTKLDAPEPGAA
ncbi:MAG TPA: DUF3105 domain-containing protein [Marmoricola sp.]|nr:DUF3105 domain-containing protein [Marmoricola sp.]HNO39398.1 DUF3105 domain-containing protein [Marmoricola sp.]